MKKLIPLYISVLFLIFACGQSDPVRDNALLWQITSNGNPESHSYLLGIYPGDGISGGILGSIPGFNEAFQSVNQYVGEYDLGMFGSENTQTFYEKWLGSISMPADSSYKDLLDAKDYEHLEFLVRFHLRMFMARESISPNYLSLWLLIMRTEDHIQNVFDRRKLITADNHLQNLSRKKGSVVKGLEPLDVKLQSLKAKYKNFTFPQLSLKESCDTMIFVVRQLDEILSVKYPKDIVNCVADIENAYKKQDMVSLSEYRKRLFELNEKFEKEHNGTCLIRINEIPLDSASIAEKNLRWVIKISEYVEEQPSFIGVNIDHLFGNDGLIKLLRARGYTVKPVRNINKV